MQIIHARKKLYSCQFCQKQFWLKRKLQFHIENQHKEENIYKCEACGKTFNLKLSLKEHVKSEHGIKVQIHSCSICSMPFQSLKRMQHHMKTAHVDPKTYQCDECDFQTNLENLMVKHKKRVHSVQTVIVKTEADDNALNSYEIDNND